MSQDEELARVWGHVVSTLESSPDITPRQIAFVRLARPLGLLDGTLLLAVGNDLTKDYLESRVRGEVTDALSAALDREARFAITVDPELAEDAPPALRVVGSGARPAARAVQPVARRARGRRGRRPSRRARRPVAGAGRRPDDRDDQVASAAYERPRRRPAAAGEPQAAGRAGAPEPEVPLRDVRHRQLATGSRTRPRSRSPRRRPRRTTRCSSTATPAWARRTCCTRSATTRRTSTRACGCAT